MAQDDVSTGPSPLSGSNVPSAYFRGIGTEPAIPSRLRIIGFRSSPAGYTVEALLLDEDGNALGTMEDKGTWSADLGCRADPLTTSVAPIVEQLTWKSTSPNSRIEVVIDHSYTSRDIASEVLRSLRDILPSLDRADSVGLALFDTNILEISSLTSPQVAAERCGEVKLTQPFGIPAVYTAMLSGLRVFDGRAQQHNTLIIVTASNDMATLSYSTSDIVEKARNNGTRIYVVKVGTSAYGYPYRYVTAATGGKLYTVNASDAGSIGSIVREIAFASKHHIEAFVQTTNLTLNCEDILLRLRYSAEGTPDLADTMLIPIERRAFRTTTAVVAAFEDTTDRGLSNYYATLAILAEDLMADSTKRVRLTGHVGPDLAGDAMSRGLDRAEHVRDYLVAYGVRKRQIEAATAGNSKPMFYLQLDGTQALLNNRVEATFLSAESLPYTIVVERVASEEQAISKVDAWSDKGYKAYFEPALVDHKPAYDIVLWGYATRSDAEAAFKGLSKKDAANAVIR